ncbi:putative transcription factor C2H2 family [Helianthus annuus]|nr:putative transcription factor C2H2 family [Helianthus annuus]
MEFTSGHCAAVTDSDEHNKPKRRYCSIFKLPSNLITSFRLIELLSPSSTTAFNNTSDEIETASEKNLIIHTTDRLTCNTCNYSFHSLHDQRSHFKSDFHRFNVISLNLILILYFFFHQVLLLLLYDFSYIYNEYLS